MNTTQDRSAETLQPGEVAALGQIAGTSFSNIGNLKSEFEKLKALKTEGDN